jgi:hypothetical protein
MKLIVEMSSVATIHTASFINIGSSIQNFLRRDGSRTQKHKAWRLLVLTFIFVK